MRLWIPSIGDQIKLLTDWKFHLFNEERNKTMFEVKGLKYDEEAWRLDKQPPPKKVVIPYGSILKIDRIYIRKGMADFDSVTFNLQGSKTKPKEVERSGYAFHTADGHGEEFKYVQKIPARGVRFWAKLSDVNNIEGVLV